MANPAKNLQTASRETGFQESQSNKLLASPPLAVEVLRRLLEYRECVVVGPPRSGKTWLNLYVAWQMEQKREAEGIWYLDFNVVGNPATDFRDFMRAVELGEGDLLIVDNWHARLDCRDYFVEWLKGKKKPRILYSWTRFPGGEDEAMEKPPLDPSRPEVPENPIDSGAYLTELAEAIVLQRLDRYRKEHPGVQVMTDFGDGDLLAAPATYKKLRGNLRYLKWRLDAWLDEESDPASHRLQEVMPEEVFRTIRVNLIHPINSLQPAAIRSLESIAVVAQWEVPYRVRPEVPPDHIEILKGYNIIFEYRDSCYMDATDAYLVLECGWREKWTLETVQRLGQHLRSLPEDVPIVLWGIMGQAEKSVKRELVAGLLNSKPILEAQKKFLLDSSQPSKLRVYSANKLANTMLGNLPKDKLERQQSIQHARTLLQGLFTEEVGNALGPAARETSLQTIMWLLKLLNRDLEFSRPFVTVLLASLGEDHLGTKLATEDNGDVQHEVLRMISYFAPDLSQTLKNAVTLQPRSPRGRDAPSAKPRQITWWLASGVLQWDEGRRERIRYLETLGESALQEFTYPAHPIGWLQALLHFASWLSPTEARRIAEMVPSLWPTLKKDAENFGNLSLILYNSRLVNSTAAADLVDIVLTEPDVYQSWLLDPQRSQAYKVGGMLLGMEVALPGSADEWCQQHAKHLQRVIATLDDNSLHTLLVPLAVYAPKSMEKIWASQEMVDRVKLPENDNSHRLVRQGIVAASGFSPLYHSKGDAPSNSALASLNPSALLFALLGMQISLGVASVEYALRQMATGDSLAHGVAGLLPQIGRYPPPWSAEHVKTMAREFIRRSPERTNALTDIVLAATFLADLGWGQQWLTRRLAQLQTGQGPFRAPDHIRGLVTAVFERLLTIDVEPASRKVRATLNKMYPLVREVQQRVEIMLGSLADRSLTLAEWDEALAGRLLASEADRWRYRLLKAGKVRCDLDTTSGRLEVKFALVREPSQDLIRQLVFGEADADLV